MREFTTTGVICTKDKYNFIYKIAKIVYTEYEDGSYLYSITPFYNVIDMLSPFVFQGIPGIDISIRKTVYERKNITPTFISERTPSDNRENLYELLEEYGMDYLNRLEWLIRSKYRYSGDNFFVKRYDETDKGITINVNSINELVKRTNLINKKLLEIICYGNNLISSEFSINDNNRSEYYKLLMSLYVTALNSKKEKQREGIDKCKAAGGFKGRKKLSIDEVLLQSVLSDFTNKIINEEEALKELGVSRSTFYRRLRTFNG